ncbi:hypothetical protein ZK44_00990 [Salmonella enterica subsp. enterica serovar Corvallis]|nr:hypothetical protein [Salmonella enterica subsp. enterica serovar Corvallis]
MVASEIADAVNVVASGIAKVYEVNKLIQPGSLVELSQPSRVIAPLIFERELYYSDARNALGNCMRTAENMYTGFYLLALNTIMQVGNISVDKTLGRVNPNRNANLMDKAVKLALESADSKSLVFLDDKGFNLQGKQKNSLDVGASDAAIELLNKDANAVTGKFLTVTLTDGQATMKMPLNISMRIASSPAEVLASILAIGGPQNTWRARWHRMMAGELSFWSDMILLSDLVREHKRISRMDKEGIRKAVNAARINAAKAAASTKIPSSGAIASTYIISKANQEAIERKIGRRLSDYNTRQKVMAEALAMQLIIIDEAEEMATFYFHSLDQGTTVSFKQLEKSNSSSTSGSDLLTILQALRTGNVPQIR